MQTKPNQFSRRATLAAIIIALASGCDQSPGPAASATSGTNSPAEQASAGSQPPIKVAVISPARQPLVRIVDLSGRVEAFESAPLHSRVAGYVKSISVDIGDKVTGPNGDQPGMVLCELLVPELREELAEQEALTGQAHAEVAQSEAAVKVAEAVVRSAEAGVAESEAAMARAEAEFERWKSESQRVSELATNNVVTPRVAEETKAQFQAASAGRSEVNAKIVSSRAALQQAQASLEKSKADASAMESRLAVKEAEHRRVAAMMDFSLIRAPFDGIVVARTVDPGHLVKAGGSDDSLAIVTIMKANPVRVICEVPEADAALVDKGSKVEIRSPSVKGEPFRGTISRTGWSLNQTSRTLTTEIDVPNPDARWRPGLFVNVKLTAAEIPDGLSLPKTAILYQDKKSWCFAVGQDGVVARIPLTTGIVAGTDVQILDGLKGDENLIAANVSAFRDGQVVEIAAPADPAAKK